MFGGLASLGKGLLVAGIAGATLAIGALGAGLGYALGEAMEAQTVMAQLDAVLKSTGAGAADYAAEYEKALDTTVEVTRLAAWQIEALEEDLATAIEDGDKKAIASISQAIAEGQELVTTTLADYTDMLPPLERVTKEMVVGLADSLSMVTRFSDEAILSAESMLLTFTNIGAETFPDATAAVLDLATAMGGDLQGASIQIGKALNDPIAGITALTRVGVTFSEEQKEVIQSLMDVGDLAGAQAIILAELEKEFGGSAEAAGGTFAGQLDILKNSLSNVAEGIGMALLPVLGDLLNKYILPLVPKIQAIGEKFTFLIGVIQAGGFGALFSVFEDGSTYIGSFLETLGMGSEQAASFGIKIAEVGQWFMTVLIPAIQQVGLVITDFVVNTLIPFVTEHWELFKGALIAVGALLIGAGLISGIIGIGTALATLFSPIGLIIAAVALLGAAWAGNWGGIRDILTEVWTTTLQPALAQLWDWLGVQIPIAMELLGEFWEGTLQPVLQALWSFISENIIPALAEFGAWLATNIPVAMEKVGEFWESTLQPALQGIGDFISENILPVLSEMGIWLGTNLPIAIEALAGFWEDTLQPALQIVWDFISEDLLPLFTTLAEFFDVVFTLALTAMAGIWENVLLPALEAVWLMVSESLKPAFDLIESVWTNTLKPALEKVEFLESLETAFAAIGTAIGTVITFVDGLIAKLKLIKLPPLFTPGSPTPAEIGFLGIAEAVEGVTRSLGGMPDVTERVKKGFDDLGTSMSGPMLFDPITDAAKKFAGDIPWIFDPIAKSLADVIREGLLEGVEAGLEGILDVAGKVSGLAGKFAGIFANKTLDPLNAQLDDLNEGIGLGLGNLGAELGLDGLDMNQLRDLVFLNGTAGGAGTLTEEQLRWAERLLAKDLEREAIAKEIAEQEERILALQEKQQQLDFLNAQLDLLKLATEAGLDASIFEGLLGLDADPAALTDLMDQILQALIDQANETLETGSPSKVFTRIGESIPDGLTESLYAGIGQVSDAMTSITDELYSPDMDGRLPDSRTYAGVTARGEGYVQNGGDTYLVSMAGAIIMSQAEADKLMRKALERTGARADQIRRGG